MLKIALAFLVAAGNVPRDDKEDLSSAAKKSTELKSFSYAGKTETQTTAGDQQGGQPQPQKVEGKYEKGVGQTILTDAVEIVKVGKISATRPRATWRISEEGVDQQQQGQGGRGRGFGQFGRGGGAPTSPLEDLADLGSKLEKCKKSDKTEKVGDDECAIYDVTLTEAAAKAMTPMARMVERAGGTIEGSGKAWIDGDGRIVKYQTVIKITAQLQNNDFEMTQTRTITLSGLNSTKVEIPEDAKKAIDAYKKKGT